MHMAILTTDTELRALLSSAKTIAVVGVSEKPWRDSYHIAEALIQRGYRVIPVNPSLTTLFGLQVFPSLDAIGEHIDIVDVFRRPEFMPEIVEDAIRVHAGAVWMQLETGNPAAAERAAQAGLTVVVNRCIMVEHSRQMRSSPSGSR
jgi:predicted CoA-binding protein